MFILSGTLINIFETPKGKTKERRKVRRRFQICKSCTKTRSETAKNALIWSIDRGDTSPYKEKLNAPVSVPVAVSVWQGKLSVRAT